MTRYILIAVAALGTTGGASAQFQPSPFYQTPSVMPNIFNPQQQPLSPYLNLLRNSNPATNYYYGVRPGTVGGTGQNLGAPFTASGGNRTLFFPQLASAADSVTGQAGPGDVLPPAGHPVVFNNTMGYFPSPFGNRGGARPGLAGVGTTRSQR